MLLTATSRAINGLGRRGYDSSSIAVACSRWLDYICYVSLRLCNELDFFKVTCRLPQHVLLLKSTSQMSGTGETELQGKLYSLFLLEAPTNFMPFQLDYRRSLVIQVAHLLFSGIPTQFCLPYAQTTWTTNLCRPTNPSEAYKPARGVVSMKDGSFLFQG